MVFSQPTRACLLCSFTGRSTNDLQRSPLSFDVAWMRHSISTFPTSNLCRNHVQELNQPVIQQQVHCLDDGPVGHVTQVSQCLVTQLCRPTKVTPLVMPCRFPQHPIDRTTLPSQSQGLPHQGTGISQQNRQRVPKDRQMKNTHSPWSKGAHGQTDTTAHHGSVLIVRVVKCHGTCH
jgi:hypothetical protein